MQSKSAMMLGTLITNCGVKQARTMAMAAIVSVALCHSVFAAPTSQEDLKQTFSEIKAQTSTLVDQQQQILDALKELKTLAQQRSAAAAAAPGPAPAAPTDPSALQPPTFTPPASMNVTGFPVEGDSNAKVAIIEITDFECEYCGRFAIDTYPRILSDYIKTGKIRFYYKDYPLVQMHKHAQSAAQAAHCADDQGKFWEMHDSLFSNQTALNDADLKSRAKKLGLDQAKFGQCMSSAKYANIVTQNMQQANDQHISGTPTFFVGKISDDGTTVTIDQTIAGGYPIETFNKVLDTELAPKS